MIDLMNINERKWILKEIKSKPNQQRKAESLRQYEIFKDRQKKYVTEYLKTQFSEETVQEMPIVSSINLARKCVKSEASIYKTSPTREYQKFSSKEQIDKLYDMYNDNGWDAKLRQANEYFKLQQQAHLQWCIKKGDLKPRVLLGHHLDVIADEEDPELGAVYVISTFNKREHARALEGVPADMAESDDYKLRLERYVVWSQDYNFTMNGKGEIVSEDIENPLRDSNGEGIIPIIDISGVKDNEYWIMGEESVTDFSIQFNGSVSDIKNVVRMQGWGQAVFTGPEGVVPEELKIGLGYVIHLKTQRGEPSDAKFEYVSANPDLMGSLEFLKALISMFLSSRDMDANEIKFDGTANSFTSGLDRFLSMIQKFEASKSDFDTFEQVEKRSFEIIRAYLNTYSNTDVLKPKWQIGEIPKDAYVTIKFAEPQMIESEDEKLDRIEKKKKLSLISDLQAYMDYWEVDETTAVKKLAEIKKERALRAAKITKQDEPSATDNALVEAEQEATA